MSERDQINEWSDVLEFNDFKAGVIKEVIRIIRYLKL